MSKTIIKIFSLFIIVSLIDLIFIRSINTFIPKIYPHIKPNAKQISIVYLFWFLIALAIYFLIVSKPDFNLKTLIKSAPLLGIFIFLIYALSNFYNLSEKWNWMMLGTIGMDILRGIILVTFSCGVYYLGKNTIGKFIK
jgi:hypothetical protein